MIAFLRGTLVEKGADAAVIDVGGIGYSVTATRGALAKMGGPGGEVMVHTLMVVREDDVSLYGFASPQERAMYQKLVGITGIGPKLAIAVLCGLSLQELSLALATRDEKRLSSIPGVGKKMAQRLILELNEQAATAMAHSDGTVNGPVIAVAGGAVQEAAEVLVTLGFSPSEAMQWAAGAAAEGDTTENIVKKVLGGMDARKR